MWAAKNISLNFLILDMLLEGKGYVCSRTTQIYSFPWKIIAIWVEHVEINNYVDVHSFSSKGTVNAIFVSFK